MEESLTMILSSGFFHATPEGEASKICPCLCIQQQNVSLNSSVKFGVPRAKQTKYLREDESTRLVPTLISCSMLQKLEQEVERRTLKVTEQKSLSLLLYSSVKDMIFPYRLHSELRYNSMPIILITQSAKYSNRNA